MKVSRDLILLAKFCVYLFEEWITFSFGHRRVINDFQVRTKGAFGPSARQQQHMALGLERPENAGSGALKGGASVCPARHWSGLWWSEWKGILTHEMVWTINHLTPSESATQLFRIVQPDALGTILISWPTEALTYSHRLWAEEQSPKTSTSWLPEAVNMLPCTQNGLCRCG